MWRLLTTKSLPSLNCVPWWTISFLALVISPSCLNMKSKSALMGWFSSIPVVARMRLIKSLAVWPAAGSEDTELGVLMEPEVDHGEKAVYARVQA